MALATEHTASVSFILSGDSAFSSSPRPRLTTLIEVFVLIFLLLSCSNSNAMAVMPSVLLWEEHSITFTDARD